MSADIYLAASNCCSGHSHNITHNLGPMFRAVGLDWHDFYEHDGNGGKTAAELLPRVVTAYFRLRDNPEDFADLEPPNGWGSLPDARDFLLGLMRDAARHPDAIVSVSL